MLISNWSVLCADLTDEKPVPAMDMRNTCPRSSATSPLGYDGQYSDADTGLIYLRARYYDPSTAQFLSVDPAVETTLSLYTYGQDDPVDQTDPSGECAAIVAAFRDSQKPLTPMEDCEKRREGLQRRYKELLKRYEGYEKDDKELKVTNTQSLKEHIYKKTTFNQLAANLASEIKTYRHRKCEQKLKEAIPPAVVAMSESKLEIRVVATGG
jgi:RHS repeat-associated protein